mgnify:CR=1 FL=1
MSALLCALSDVILITAGVFGGSALLSQSEIRLILEKTKQRVVITQKTNL